MDGADTLHQAANEFNCIQADSELMLVYDRTESCTVLGSFEYPRNPIAPTDIVQYLRANWGSVPNESVYDQFRSWYIDSATLRDSMTLRECREFDRQNRERLSEKLYRLLSGSQLVLHSHYFCHRCYVYELNGHAWTFTHRGWGQCLASWANRDPYISRFGPFDYEQFYYNPAIIERFADYAEVLEKVLDLTKGSITNGAAKTIA